MKIEITRVVGPINDSFLYEGSAKEFVDANLDGALAMYLSAALTHDTNTPEMDNLEAREHYLAGYEDGYGDVMQSLADDSGYCEQCNDYHDTAETGSYNDACNCCKCANEAPWHECVHEDGEGVSCNCVYVEDCQLLDDEHLCVLGQVESCTCSPNVCDEIGVTIQE